MNITQIAIRRGVTFIMIYLIAIGFGLFSLARLNLDLYPKLEFPMIAIITQYTGVSPYDIETVVTRPMEEAVASAKNVKKVSSTSSQGLSIISLEFEWGTDMDQAKIDVRDNLDFVRDALPDDIIEPLIVAFDFSAQPVLYLSVASVLHGQAELRRISEREIEPRIERIPGVAAVFTMGGMRREIKVQADPARLRATQISIQQVSTALQMNNMQVPSGWIENAEQEFTLQTLGEYTSIEEIENTPVAVINGSVIRVKDVATVVDGFAEQRQKVWTNDKPAVVLVIQKQSDANSVNVCRRVFERLPEIEAALPRGVRIENFYDAATFINRSMSNLGNTAIQAIGLVFLVLLFFLRNLRSSVIVAISIPVSMVITFAVMDQAGLTLNIISMAGLALAVGLLVDNSIVVLESIFRHREQGKEIREAAHIGAREVAMAITASTLTTLSVFIPVLFVPGIAGELFNEMVVTICFSLAVSLLVALTLIPLLASRFLYLKEAVKDNKTLSRLTDRVNRWLEKMHDVYSRILRWSLYHRKTVLFSVAGIFILSVFIMINLGGEFMPETDMGFIAIAVDRSPGTSMESMEKSAHRMNEIILESVPESETVFANFGQGEGMYAMFSSRASSQGDITIRLKPLRERDRSMFEVQDELRERFKELPDVDTRFEDRGAEALFGAGGDIVVEIFGYDLSVSEALANDILKRAEDIDGIVHSETSVQELTPELRISLDRQRIADLGLSTARVGDIISTSVMGSVVTRYREGGDEYDIRVQLVKEARTSKMDVENILIPTPRGKQIPLRALANVEYSKAPTEIIREDQERLVTVTMDVAGRDLRSVTGDVADVLKRVSVPGDYRLEIGGVAEEQQESFMYLGMAMLVAIILTYMVMASQFESLVDPFVIIFTIPLSFIGVALGLLVTGTSLSVMALVGMVMLVGIVVNNGIVLVDYINQLRARGKDMFDAILEGSRIRMRPVLMTALTTILAMLPLAVGLGESGENWAPMARSVMGGLTVGTILTLLVVPVIYAVVERFAEKVKARVRKIITRDESDVATGQA
jgi:HAE1 family hydrophobic/amphiphilic exporter-1